jgi:hypothetical protein
MFVQFPKTAPRVLIEVHYVMASWHLLSNESPKNRFWPGLPPKTLRIKQ